MEPIIIDRKSMITVRLDGETHAKLLDIARKQKRSLNTLCRSLLENYADAYVDVVTQKLQEVGRC